nr:MAG TPA: hypothetical protein [Caudoviricetes sp.]
MHKLTAGGKNRGSAAWIGGAEALRAVIPGVTTTAATGP